MSKRMAEYWVHGGDLRDDDGGRPFSASQGERRVVLATDHATAATALREAMEVYGRCEGCGEWVQVEGWCGTDGWHTNAEPVSDGHGGVDPSPYQCGPVSELFVPFAALREARERIAALEEYLGYIRAVSRDMWSDGDDAVTAIRHLCATALKGGNDEH